MDNEEYQALIRLPGLSYEARLEHATPQLRPVLQDVTDVELPSVIANLGGHDLAELLAVLDQAAQPVGNRRSSLPIPSKAGVCPLPATRSITPCC
ncbi:MAG: hypothetical protein R3E79_26680 [Caldilineaceae bacterium]